MSIIITKLFIPPVRPQIVVRSHLLQLLEQGLHRKLTLISAPAGFGKTSLISEWVSSTDRPVAWLSLDDGDNDLNLFLRYLVSAIQKVFSGFGEGVLAALQTSQSPSLESLLTTLLNEIATVSQDFTLVLDDYSRIESAQIDQALNFILEHLPSQMHLVLTTREDPNLPLARLRVHNELTELRAAELRFTVSESSQFLVKIMGLQISEEEVRALETRTEGWISGLQLAALSLQGYEDASPFIKSFTGSHHFVMDYLMEEVLNQQPQEVQDFLIFTSILERFCSSLCQDILPADFLSPRETLEKIEQGNLFIIPLDNERRWYRYHHLFSSMLQERLLLRTSQEGVELSELHRKASQWYQKNGWAQEAIHHASLVEDWERVADLAELAWPEMDQNCQHSTWLAWAQVIPNDIVYKRPVLGYEFASAYLIVGELDRVEPRLQQVEKLLAKHEPSTFIVVDEVQFLSLVGSIAITRTYLAQWQGNSEEALKYTQIARESLPEGDYQKRGVAEAILGLSYWSAGDLDLANQSFTACVDFFKFKQDIMSEINGKVGLSLVLMAQGHLQKLRNLYEWCLERLPENGASQIIASANIYLGLSEVLCEQGKLVMAEECLVKARQLSQKTIIFGIDHLLSLAQILIDEARGEVSKALETMKEAERNFLPTPIPILRPLKAWKARLCMRQGQLLECQSWMMTQGISLDSKINYSKEFELITYCWILLQEPKQRAGLEAFLLRLLTSAQEGGRIRSQVEILILMVLVYQSNHEEAKALAVLDQALILAETEGYVQLFLLGMPTLTPLLAKAENIYARTLLTFANVEGETQTKLSRVPVTQNLAEPLSQREMEVLELIAEGLSNQEISERLFIALSTVKGHNQNIFGKLQAQRRTEAIIKAKELGLL